MCVSQYKKFCSFLNCPCLPLSPNSFVFIFISYFHWIAVVFQLASKEREREREREREEGVSPNNMVRLIFTILHASHSDQRDICLDHLISFWPVAFMQTHCAKLYKTNCTNPAKTSLNVHF